MFFHADVHPASACEFRPGSSCTSPWNHDNTAHERRSEYGESTWLKKIPMTRTRIHHFPVKVNSLHASALFPTKLSLDTLGLCCCLRIICETSLRPSGVMARHNYSAETFGTSSILLLKAAATPIHSPRPSFAAVPTHRSRYSSHALSNARGRRHSVTCLACRSNPNLITSGLDFSSPSI
jgi:hypothetical protein